MKLEFPLDEKHNAYIHWSRYIEDIEIETLEKINSRCD